MDPRDFSIDPAAYGLPTREERVAYRIWDDHFHGFNSPRPIEQYETNSFYVERMGIEHSISNEIGGTLQNPFTEAPFEAEMVAILERDKARLSGLTPIDPGDPEKSCAKIEKWVRRGPCIGIKYQGGPSPIRCDHPNNDPIMRLAEELEAFVYIHTWLKVGGSPRLPGGDNGPHESTPENIANIARRFPNVPMICGHSGGDWELGVRTVRPVKNILLEFAGSDPHSGAVEYAVRELGADRIVWGGHGPSRSYATELGKVFDADISRSDRLKILGANLRRIAAPSFRRKGRNITI